MVTEAIASATGQAGNVLSIGFARRQLRQQAMEPLWSPVVATGRNKTQTGSAEAAQIRENRCRALRLVAAGVKW
jgi:hypothetical protein